MVQWLHTLQQFQFSIVHRAGRDHSNADRLSRAPISPCAQCTRVDCPQVDTAVEVADQFLAPLCHLAAELFKCRLVRRRQLSRGGGGGGKGQSQKRFSNFFSFLA